MKLVTNQSSIFVVGVAVLAYSLALILRGGELVQFRFAGAEGHSFPRGPVALVVSYVCVVFTAGPLLLLTAIKRRWIKEISVWNRRIPITTTTEPPLIVGLWVTGISILLSIALIWVPESHLRLDRAEILYGFPVGVVGSAASATYSLMAVRRADRAVSG